MAIVRAKALAIVRVPYIHEVVLRNRKEQIALAVKLDLVQRTGMTRKHNRALVLACTRHASRRTMVVLVRAQRRESNGVRRKTREDVSRGLRPKYVK